MRAPAIRSLSTIALTVVVFSMFFSVPSSAQVDLAWIRYFPAQKETDAIAYRVFEDSSGDLLVGGALGDAAAAVKYDASGQEVWSVVDSSIIPKAMQLTGNGAVIIAGTTPWSQGPFRIVVSQRGPSSSEVWRATIADTTQNWESPTCVAEMSNGAIVVSGFNCDPSGDCAAGIIARFAPDGVMEWRLPVGTKDAPGVFQSIVPVADGGCIVSGDIGTRRYRADGTITWTSPCSGDRIAYFPDSAKFVVSGTAQQSDTQVVGVMNAMDTSGQLLWSDTLSDVGQSYWRVSGLDIDRAGDVYAVGDVWIPWTTTGFILKLDEFGQRLWFRSVATGVSSLECKVHPSGGIVVSSSSSAPVEVTRLSPLGDTIWTVQYSRAAPPSPYAVYDLVVQADSGICIVGSALMTLGGGPNHFMTIRFAQCAEAPATPTAPVPSLLAPCPNATFTVDWPKVPLAYKSYDLYENDALLETLADSSFPVTRSPGEYVYRVAARNACGVSALGPASDTVRVRPLPSPAAAPTTSDSTPCFDAAYAVIWLSVPSAVHYELLENGHLVYDGSDTSVSRQQYAGTFSYSVRAWDDCGPHPLSSTGAQTVVAECWCHADPSCDGVKADVLDVTAIIDIAFRGADPFKMTTCPFENTDVDCSGTSDLADVVKMIDVAFRGVSAASRFCNPCL